MRRTRSGHGVRHRHRSVAPACVAGGSNRRRRPKGRWRAGPHAEELEDSADHGGVRAGQEEVDGERRVVEGVGRPAAGNGFQLGEHDQERTCEVTEAGQLRPRPLAQLSDGGDSSRINDGHAVTAAKRSAKPSAGTTRTPPAAGIVTASNRAGSTTPSQARAWRPSSTRPRASTVASERWRSLPRPGGSCDGEPSQAATPNPTMTATGSPAGGRCERRRPTATRSFRHGRTRQRQRKAAGGGRRQLGGRRHERLREARQGRRRRGSRQGAHGHPGDVPWVPVGDNAPTRGSWASARRSPEPWCPRGDLNPHALTH